jgi:hypothetical protein
MVKNMIKWSLFCAATQREFKHNLDWTPYFAVAKKDLPFEDRLKEYAKIAHQRFETERFQAFCDQHLGHLDEVAWEFFGSARCKEIFRAKVAALYPAHEIDKFTDHFFGLVQFWRRTEEDRMAAAKTQREARLAVLEVPAPKAKAAKAVQAADTAPLFPADEPATAKAKKPAKKKDA